MINIINKQNCCGCEACVQACPKHCISFEEDIEGFRYPSVNNNICIDCGLCEKVCPVLNCAEESMPLEVYAAKNRNEKELLNSSSGGIFILLAKTVIQKGGVVFGAKFDEDWNVVHAYAETEEEMLAFMGSKYVQSRIGNTYREAKAFLDAGRTVLFSGTSCHIAGLKHFLRKEYDNLLTVDVICHGVPSPKVWRLYLDEVKKNARKGKNSVSLHPNHSVSERNTLEACNEVDIESISFRDKKLGWQKFSFALTLAEATDDGKKNTVSLSSIHPDNPFMKVFLHNIILRPSCYHCSAKGGRCQSDITIADFWGIEYVQPSFNDSSGVGLLMINTQRGKDIVYTLDLDTVPVSLEDATRYNLTFFKSVLPHPRREKFFRKFMGTRRIIHLMNTIVKPPIMVRIRRILSKIKHKLLHL